MCVAPRKQTHCGTVAARLHSDPSSSSSRVFGELHAQHPVHALYDNVVTTQAPSVKRRLSTFEGFTPPLVYAWLAGWMQMCKAHAPLVASDGQQGVVNPAHTCSLWIGDMWTQTPLGQEGQNMTVCVCRCDCAGKVFSQRQRLLPHCALCFCELTLLHGSGLDTVQVSARVVSTSSSSFVCIVAVGARILENLAAA